MNPSSAAARRQPGLPDPRTAPRIQRVGLVFPPVRRTKVEVLQVNLGRLCNQACLHCHVDSSPARNKAHENASVSLVDRILELLEARPALHTLDLTGGAPELNPGFRRLVRGARALGRKVLVRHNLTVMFEPGQEDLPEFFAGQKVLLFCSLPCYQPANVEKQRGQGVFDKSVAALRRLNRAGFGNENTGLELNLVYNPVGASLPPLQEALEADYRRELSEHLGLRFTRLVTLTNQPIHRFRESLERQGRLREYQELLESNFNAATLPNLMCRSQVSLRWDGALFDCDFNLVIDLPLRGRDGRALTLDDLFPRPEESGEAAFLEHLPVTTASHCFACTAGAGSSCGGSLA